MVSFQYLRVEILYLILEVLLSNNTFKPSNIFKELYYIAPKVCMAKRAL
jgi:hypothetical protein